MEEESNLMGKKAGSGTVRTGIMSFIQLTFYDLPKRWAGVRVEVYKNMDMEVLGG